MLTTIRDDTWKVPNIQHIIPNPKRWDYSDILSGGHKYIKGPAHMVEGGHHPLKYVQDIFRHVLLSYHNWVKFLLSTHNSQEYMIWGDICVFQIWSIINFCNSHIVCSITLSLIPKQLEMNECILSSVANDDLVLK